MILKLARNALLLIEPETAHHLSILGLRIFSPRVNFVCPESLNQNIWGMDFLHPIGLAAGFDKDADAFNALSKLGFSFIEVGSVTPNPQPGNPRPRLFRLKEEEAIINRYGFNSKRGGLCRKKTYSS